MSKDLPTIIVPARLSSIRFPRKLLQKIDGIPLIIHTAKRIKEIAPEFDSVFAVDGDELKSLLVNNGFRAIMTEPNLSSGTDRIFAANQRLLSSRIINIQADEPLVSREHILSLVKAINKDNARMATLAVPFRKQEDFVDKNQVKVVLDQFGFALFFSRLPIPEFRDNLKFDDYIKHGYKPLKHLGMYAYTKEFLEKFAQAPPGLLEKIEKLEQLRALEMGEKILVSEVESETLGIDIPEDLKKLGRLLLN